MIGRPEATLIKRIVQILVSVLLAVSTLGAVDSKPFTFPRSTPEAQGVSSAALLGFIEAAEQQIDALHSFMPRGARAKLVLLNIGHLNEHYGNLVTYFRVKWMVPPSSRGQ